MGSHYYKKPASPGKKNLISLYIHGYTFEFVSYQALFSGTRIDPGTYLLLENIVVPDKGAVLDIGCGYGVIGIVVAKINPSLKVYMVDINPLAVKIAKVNARRNRVEKNTVILHGNLYEPVNNLLFTAIYSNPPFSAGMEVVEAIIAEAPRHLVHRGFLQMVVSRGHERVLELAQDYFSEIHVVKRRRGYTVLVMYK